jgi:uroporphyrinogen-III synthase
MPPRLAGFRVGVTGDRRSAEQIELLTRRGAQVLHGPVMRTDLLTDADATMAATEAALDRPLDAVVLTTGIGARSWFAVAESVGLDDRLRGACARAIVLARGPKARSAANAHGVEIHWEAPGETSAEVVAWLRRWGAAGRRIAVQRDGGDPLLGDALRTAGADVVDVPVYRWHAPADGGPARRLLDAATAGRLHAVTFTCAYAVGSAFELAPDPVRLRAALDGRVLAVAVGPVTEAALRKRGVRRVVTPARARLGAMVQALTAALVASAQEVHLEGGAVMWQGDLLVHGDGTTAPLTPAEARLLRALVERAPAVVAKRALVEGDADLHAVEASVARLRAKLGPLAPALRTVPRRGYALARLPAAPEDDPGRTG